MNAIKTIFKRKGSRVWFIVSTCLIIFFLIVTILANTVFYDLLCQVLGRSRPIFAEGAENATVYETEYKSKEEARKHAEEVNEAVTADGMVLLKNEDKNGDPVLPLASGAKISVFGKNSVNIVTGGTGSAAGSGEYVKGLEESLTDAGFSLNPTLSAFYKSSESGAARPSQALSDSTEHSPALTTAETPQSLYTQAVWDSCAQYSDAALIVISRIGGESFDLPRTMKDKQGNPVAGARDPDDHYLQLDQNETDLIKAVAERFDKIVVLLNTSTTMELGFLDDETHYAYSEKIGACIWMGVPGDTGVMSLGKLLKGEIAPSGRTVDTFARNFKHDPTWQNFGDNLSDASYTDIGDRVSGYTYAYADYEEGIYFGYKYYETRAKSYEGPVERIGEKNYDDGEAWYQDHVVYPFGYGLSYTTFTQKFTGNKPTTLTLDKDGNGTVQLRVQVTNTGSVAAKEAVQVYVTLPYTKGGIEKPYVMLASFGKTAETVPADGTATVDLTIDLYNLASYDADDKNGNGHRGYELEAGDYVFRLMSDAHHEIESFTANLATTFNYEKDPATGYAVENRFEDADDELGTQLSRADWAGTFPAPRTAEERKLSAEHNAMINSVETNNPNKYTKRPTMGAEPDYVIDEATGEYATDEAGNLIRTLVYKDLAGAKYTDERWETLLDYVTYTEAVDLINKGAFKTVEIKSIEKSEGVDADGPAGWADFMANPATATVYGVSHYCCEPLMAATFDTALIKELGNAVGDEALIGNERGGGMPYSGWYAPGMNMHRSPFGGRAGEYFSEDPILTGFMGAYEIKGAMERGVYTQVKHFALNEQETNRSGTTTWVGEQALRESYLRAFELAVKVGGTHGMMSSFNRIGTKWTGGDYRLLTEVLRNEWGFTGMVICDYDTHGYMDNKQMAYAGGDLGLTAIGQSWTPGRTDATDLTVLRSCVKNILFTTVNSNLVSVEILGYAMPYWQIGVIVFDCVLFVGLAVWGIFAITGALKKEKAGQ